MITRLERIILENPDLADDRKRFKLGGPQVHRLSDVTVPADYRKSGVSQFIFDAWSKGCTKACVDVVICTETKHGLPAVLALKRSAGTPYAGTWYMPGGALFAYMSISDFLAQKAEKECGYRPELEAIIGVYRNDAENMCASVISPCYVATAPLDLILETRPADGHDSWRLITLEELEGIPKVEQHWYPMHVFRRALETMP